LRDDLDAFRLALRDLDCPMKLRTLLFASPSLLLLACDGEEKEETGGGKDTATDTADTGTDTGSDTDTGTDTGQDSDTGDTAQPVLPTNGYFGPPTVMVLADDGSGGAIGYLIDPTTGVATAVADLAVSKTAALACAGQMVWVMDDQGGSSTDNAYGVEARSGAIAQTIPLGAGFAGQTALYFAETYWFGGLGSASLLSFDGTGTAGGTVDLSSLADADGKPEVTALFPAEGSAVAVLRRENTTAGSYEKSMVALIDLAAMSVTSSASLEGRNAGRAATGAPGGLAVDMRLWATDAGGIEGFDLTTNASKGRSVEYAPAERIAAHSAGTDGTFWVALKSEGVTKAHHYLHDGTELDTGFTVSPSGDLLTTAPGGVFVGEGSVVMPYEDRTGTAGTAISIGSKVLAIQGCTPPPREPDTGDTAANP